VYREALINLKNNITYGFIKICSEIYSISVTLSYSPQVNTKAGGMFHSTLSISIFTKKD
jgi:hypothetical protein